MDEGGAKVWRREIEEGGAKVWMREGQRYRRGRGKGIEEGGAKV